MFWLIAILSEDLNATALRGCTGWGLNEGGEHERLFPALHVHNASGQSTMFAWNNLFLILFDLLGLFAGPSIAF